MIWGTGRSGDVDDDADPAPSRTWRDTPDETDAPWLGAGRPRRAIGQAPDNLGCPATRSPGSTPAPPPPLMRCAKASFARMATAEAAG